MVVFFVAHIISGISSWCFIGGWSWFRLDSYWIPKNEREDVTWGYPYSNPKTTWPQTTNSPLADQLAFPGSIIYNLYHALLHSGIIYNLYPHWISRKLSPSNFNLRSLGSEDWDEPLDTAKASSKQITADPIPDAFFGGVNFTPKER